MGFALNDGQKRAVEHGDGPMLVVAGAGTGKTKVIIERFARLIESGVDRQHILAITFTEKAAQEMRDRAAERLEGSYGAELNIYTFNALGHELLCEFAIEIGLSANLQLIGDNGKVVLLREHLDELELDYFAPISQPDRQLADLAGYFSQLKQQLIQPEDYAAYASKLPAADDEQKLDKQRHTELACAFSHYIEICRERNIIDYDDQIYLLVWLLELRPNILQKLRDRYRYVMVDEFQDTNPMQSRLIDLLAGEPQNIFAVGDDDQSIYGWRGATLANILEFTKRYPSAAEITLIENFRSTQEVLDGAWQLIQNNNPARLEAMNNLDKRLVAHRGSGLKPAVHTFSRLDAELNWVAEDIKQRISDGTDPGNIAVLGRSKQTVARVHMMLEAVGIDHTVAGLTDDLYKHPAVATMIETLKTITDPEDNSALYHTLGGALFGINPQLLSETSASARREHESLEGLLKAQDDATVQAALKLLAGWRERASVQNVRELCYDILSESGYRDRLIAEAENSVEAGLAAQALGQWFSTLLDFEQVSNLPTATNYLISLPALRAEGETIAADDTSNIINTLPVVMTAHKAKGLEWEIVYVVDCTEQSFPLKNQGSSLTVPDALTKTSAADDHYAEERRLMYVAMTRARDTLIITHSESHNGVTKRKPSRFIEELSGQGSGEMNGHEKLVGLELLRTVSGIRSTVPLPARLLRNGVVTLTASQADDFLRCGLNFYYKHVLCVPEVPTAAASVGSLLHTFLQEINEAKLDGRELPALEQLEERLQSSWPRVGYSSKLQRERAIKNGLASLRRTYERLAAEPVPLAVETDFALRIPDSKLMLNGRIDVIMPLGDGVEIRDYKTSASATTPEKAKSQTTASNQLVMYALAWRELHGEAPVAVTLDFVQTGQVGTVKKRPDSLDKMQAKLSEAAELILRGEFPAGSSHDRCIHPI